ncbi:transposase [Oscillibacter ruminantium]
MCTVSDGVFTEAEKLTQAAKYERSEERQGYRSGHYSRNLTTTSGDVTLNVPRLKGISFETAISPPFPDTPKVCWRACG